MTTAPSIIIPKSTAPRDRRLALMPAIFRHRNANSSDSGMTMETISVVRQSAINRNTITVTKIIPSIRLCIMVLVVKSIRSFRSYTVMSFTSLGKILVFSSSILAFTPSSTSSGFSPLRIITIPSTTSLMSLYPAWPTRGSDPSCTVATFLTSTGLPLSFRMITFSISLVDCSKPIPRTT